MSFCYEVERLRCFKVKNNFVKTTENLSLAGRNEKAIFIQFFLVTIYSIVSNIRRLLQQSSFYNRVLRDLGTTNMRQFSLIRRFGIY